MYVPENHEPSIRPLISLLDQTHLEEINDEPTLLRGHAVRIEQTPISDRVRLISDDIPIHQSSLVPPLETVGYDETPLSPSEMDQILSQFEDDGLLTLADLRKANRMLKRQLKKVVKRVNSLERLRTANWRLGHQLDDLLRLEQEMLHPMWEPSHEPPYTPTGY
jgi:hypothetical protein